MHTPGDTCRNGGSTTVYDSRAWEVSNTHRQKNVNSVHEVESYTAAERNARRGHTARAHLANTVLEEKSTSQNNAGDRVVCYQL